MKRLIAILLTLCALLAMTACGDDYDPNAPISMFFVEGWYTKADASADLPLDTFHVDGSSYAVISYDASANELARYECWCEEDYNGFSVDIDGTVYTYKVQSGQMLDDAGSVVYTACEPLIDTPDNGGGNGGEVKTINHDAIMGTWSREDDAVQLVVDANGYHVERDGEKSKDVPVEIAPVSAEYLGLSYNGPVLSTDPTLGEFDVVLWILENGTVMYDDLQRRFYLHESLSGDARSLMYEKYDIVRDAWCSTTTEDVVYFNFDGVMRLISNGEVSDLGTWKHSSGTITVTYTDGTTEEIQNGDLIEVGALGQTFKREAQWG